MKPITTIIIAFLLIGCGGPKRPPKPDNLISKDQMSEVLYDVFLMNAAKGINKKILENNGIFPQDHIYKKHGIDSLQFAKSNAYYAFDIKTYEGIIGKVKQKLEQEKATHEAIHLEEEKIKDSIEDAKNKLKKADSLPKTIKGKRPLTVDPSKKAPQPN